MIYLMICLKTDHGEGTTDEIILIGCPQGNQKQDYDTLTGAMEANHPDLIFLQVNPEPYLVRQRFLSHKCALKGVEDYEKNVNFYFGFGNRQFI